MQIRCFLGPGLCAVLSFAAAFAQVVPISFEGTVTQANFDPGDPFAGSVHLGTTFSGSFVFDPASADALPADPLTGSYASNGLPFRTTLTVGGRLFTVNDFLHIGVANDYSGSIDQYTVVAGNTDASVVIELFLEDSGGTAFDGDALPLTPVSLASLPLARLVLTAHSVDGNYVEVLGQVTSLAFVAPTIASITPGSVFPGAEVTILGSGFFGEVQVTFNGIAGVVTVVNENTLVVIVPELPPGPLTVTVTTPGGSVTAPPGSLTLGPAIPTLSGWALLFLFVALLTLGTLRLGRRHDWRS
jgi:hypothetical protein